MLREVWVGLNNGLQECEGYFFCLQSSENRPRIIELKLQILLFDKQSEKDMLSPFLGFFRVGGAVRSWVRST